MRLVVAMKNSSFLRPFPAAESRRKDNSVTGWTPPPFLLVGKKVLLNNSGGGDASFDFIAVSVPFHLFKNLF